MAMSIVRCPFCDRRYNVTGIPSGTKVLCTSCRATLTVPAMRQPLRAAWWRRLVPESASAQITLGVIGGLVVATAAYLAIRSRTPVAPEMAAAPEAAGAKAAPAGGWERGESVPFMPQGSRDEQVEWFTGRIYREFGANKFLFDARSDSPFVLAGELHPRVNLPTMFDEFQNALKSLMERFRAEIVEPLQLGEPHEILPILVFTSRETFDDYLRGGNNAPLPPEVPGLYEYQKRRVVFLHERKWYPIEVLLHEATHQLIHYHFRYRADADKRQSWWFQEGMAVYFEQFKRTPTAHVEVDPSLPSPRLPVLKDAVRRGDLPALWQVMGMDLDEIWKHWNGPGGQQGDRMRFTQLCYGEAWALVHYLRHGAAGKYRKLFDEYVQEELKGRGGKGEFERLLSSRFGMQLPELQRELEEYLRGM